MWRRPPRQVARWIAVAAIVAAAGVVAGVLLTRGDARPIARAVGRAGLGEIPHFGRKHHPRKPPPKTVSGPHDRPVPILMYHVVAAPPANAPYPGLYVLPADFAAQMRWLAQHGYHAVTLGAVYAYWHDARPLPSRPIVLTFDDGYRSDFVAALPVLEAHRWPGVLNLTVKNEGESWGLSPARVRKLLADGWELGSHTLTHADLTTLDPAALRREVAGSRRELRRQFGQPVDFFCYPAGRYDDAVVAAVRAAGYVGATTVRPGLGRPSQLYTLARIRVGGSDGVAGLAAKLAS